MMSYYPNSIIKLIKSFARLPGVGEKTAERLALHILRAPVKEVEEFSANILQAREKTSLCTKCFGLSDSEVCRICRDLSRTSDLLCVVEQPADMVAIEKSGAFIGYYHILSGVLSPMDGIGPDDIRVKELFSRIEKENIKEIVLATSTSLEGESTASYIAEKLQHYSVKVTRIASGVPIGGDLKYVDPATLKRAMEGRHGL